MRNNYEMPEVFDLGRAIEEILGSKPIVSEIEAVLGFPYRIEPLPDDMDESND